MEPRARPAPWRGRRLRTAVALLAAVLVAVAPVASSDAGPAAAKVVPSQMCRGLWIVPIAFGDGGPERTLRMVLDTGAGSTSVDPDAIQRVFGKRVRAGKKITLRDGEAGPMTIHKLRARTHDMDHLSLALGSRIDGILGFPTFREHLLTLDYPRGEVRVGTGELPEVDGVRIVRDVGTLRPYLSLEPGAVRVPVLVDSGSTGALTLRESDPVPWKVEPRATSAVVRYVGIRVEREGRMDGDVAVGQLVVRDPIVKLTDDGTRLLGYQFMRRFSWTFDTRNRRIELIPDGDAPIESPSEHGIGVAFRPVEGGFEVARVFDGLPGARAGLSEGDVVVAVNGVHVVERGCAPLIDPASNGPLLLTVRRDDLDVDVEVVPEILAP